MRPPARSGNACGNALSFPWNRRRGFRRSRAAPIPDLIPNLRIRDGRRADLAALSEIETRAFAADRLSPRSLRRLIGRPSGGLRVAVTDGEIVGYHLVLTRAGSRVARLYSIAVAAAARGAGVGARLLADAERAARRAGAAHLRLEVRPDNAGAIRLYEQHGYARIGTRPDYYADGADALRYQKTLARAVSRAAGSSRQGAVHG